MAHRAELENCMNALLDAGRFKDYGPNGLQVEGKTDIGRIVTGVTASLALIEAAIEAQAGTRSWSTMVCSGAAMMGGSPAG